MTYARICRTCGIEKSIDEFPVRLPNKIGVCLSRHMCKSCASLKTLVGVTRRAYLRDHSADARVCEACEHTKPIAAFAFEDSLDRDAAPVLKSECRVCERVKTDAVLLQKKNAIDKRLYAERRDAEAESRITYQAERHTITGTKLCHDCLQEKPLTEFVFARTLKSGIRQFLPRCNECRAKATNLAKAENPDLVAAHTKRGHAWRMAHLEESREYRRDYNATYLPQWHLDNPGKSKEYTQKRRALRRGAKGSHTAADVADIRRMQKDRCANPACRCKLEGKGHVDHRIALSKGGTNDRRNLQILCNSCNSKKYNKDEIDFMQSLGFLI